MFESQGFLVYTKNRQYSQMTEKYEKDRVEIAAGYFLRVITAYKLITAVSAPASEQDTIFRTTEMVEYRQRTPTASKLTRTLEINPTQIDIFDTLRGAWK